MPYKDPEKRKAYNQAYSKQHYIDNKATYKSKARKNNIAYITRNREFLDNFKLNASCKLCGYNKCAEALDFHHISEHNKEANVSRLANESNSLERIQEEISKCIVVCARCHREIHAGMAEQADAGDLKSPSP